MPAQTRTPPAPRATENMLKSVHWSRTAVGRVKASLGTTDMEVSFSPVRCKLSVQILRPSKPPTSSAVQVACAVLQMQQTNVLQQCCDTSSAGMRSVVAPNSWNRLLRRLIVEKQTFTDALICQIDTSTCYMPTAVSPCPLVPCSNCDVTNPEDFGVTFYWPHRQEHLRGDRTFWPASWYSGKE